MMRRTLLVLMIVLQAVWLPAAEWKLALPGYRYAFPQDHFDHPEFQTEWWYFTGNVRSASGREFGFELTFFRQGRHAATTESAGTWDTSQLYLAHLALTDIGGKRFHHAERLNRSGPALAGADRATSRIWNGNWSTKLTGTHDWELAATHEAFQLRMNLRSDKPPVLHGENGVHQKAEGAGKASHYISLTRLMASGEIVLDGEKIPVNGSAWMDHEFFTHSMSGDQTGWDWFAIQLDDRSEVMLYRLRRRDGSVEPLSGGTFVAPDGSTTRLVLADFKLRTTRTWTSEVTGGRYPIGWDLEIPRIGLQLRAEPTLEAQELRSERKIGPSYWEGAMRFQGTRGGKPVRGVGYLELTGYADEVNLSGSQSRGGMTR
jgi:predicted secreted hydrolase